VAGALLDEEQPVDVRLPVAEGVLVEPRKGLRPPVAIPSRQSAGPIQFLSSTSSSRRSNSRDELGEKRAGVVDDRRESVGRDPEELPRAAAVRPI
jgi:hypothetical protein